jgi:Na+-transporting NADH:ubiquinone oxidoreductase subunit D
MSVETTLPPKAEAKKDGLLSKKNRKVLTDPLDDNNPITVQILGVCSALAVTTQVKPAIIMAIGLMIVTAFSNLIIALIRDSIPGRIRMIVQLVIVALLVTLVDQLLKAFMFDVSKKLSVFVGLIITNCIVMGRLEAYAMSQKPWPSFLDGIGNGLGYGLILVIVSVIREFFGSGSILGFHLVPLWAYQHGYSNNGLMMLPPSALFIIGCYIWWQRSKNKKLINAS